MVLPKISGKEMTKRGFIVGTAGHVDHGKSTLVQRMTGIDPDRLPEEKARQMTIELGFAPLTLPSGRRCGVVDVPGHEKLVRQMLMGAQGFDLVLFTVACDEGPKRQTLEHLSILDIIGIKLGIIVLTKCDLPHDEEGLEIMIDNMVRGTILENAPRMKVSAHTGEGIPELKTKIDELLELSDPRPLDMPAFYPIDRVFAVKGFGVVTTGTLWQGAIKKGEEYEIFPSRKKGKIRGIEYFDAQIDFGEAGNRLALNFQNLEKDDLNRGDMIATPNRFNPVVEFDAKIRLLTKVKRRTRLKFHFAAIEQEVDYSDIGDGFARIRLESPLPLARNSRFILRSIAPPDTIGGGNIFDLEPKGKLNAESTIERLRKLELATPEEYLAKIVEETDIEGKKIAEVRGLVNWADSRFEAFLKDPQVVQLSGLLFSKKVVEGSTQKLTKLIAEFFRNNPSRSSLPKAEARTKLWPEMSENLFFEIIKQAVSDPFKLDGQNIVSSSTQQTQKSELETFVENDLLRQMYQPPSLGEIRQFEKYKNNRKELEAVLSKLISEKIIFKAVDDLFFHKKAIISAFRIMKGLIDRNGQAKLSEYRDAVGTSRKYAQAMLELLDAWGLTRRVGETRVFGTKALDMEKNSSK